MIFFVLGARCVRDWSGILCEQIGNGFWEWDLGTGFGNGDGIWGREWDLGTGTGFGSEMEMMASKDIAESPTRSGTPR